MSSAVAFRPDSSSSLGRSALPLFSKVTRDPSANGLVNLVAYRSEQSDQAASRQFQAI